MWSIYSAISTDLIGITVLLFTLYLVRNNTILTKKKTRQYMVTTALTLAATVLEIATVFLNGTADPAMRIPHIIANVLGFSLAPFVPLSMALLYDDNLHKYRGILSVPLCLQAVICVISAWTGWVFSVSVYNQYSRGPLFWLSALVSLYSFAILIHANHQGSKDYDAGQRIYLLLLYLLVLSGNVVQIIFGNILLIWASASVSILLYYIFLRELQFTFDPMTGVRNRSSFEKKIVEMQKSRDIAVVVMDCNNLKRVNDQLGHHEGDRFLADAAEIMKKSFEEMGTVYRIGGDEFCVLCKEVNAGKLEGAFAAMNDLLEKRNTEGTIPLSIAYGYEIYKNTESGSIFDSFEKADMAMYAQKKILKNHTAGDRSKTDC